MVFVGAACGGDADTAGAPASTVVEPEPPAVTAPVSSTAPVAAGAPDEPPAGDDVHAGAIEATRAVFDAVGADDPGCTVAVGIDGEVVYAEAFGAARLDPSEPMTTETIVDIGSTSKQFTATAALLLAQRGEVDLDEALSAYLPDLADWDGDPTVRQLIHHTSGIPDYISLLVEDGFELTGSSTDADALDALAEVAELDFAPGSSWAYSNSNYFLLGQVVLAVTGLPLDEFLDREVFEPLALDMVMDPVAALDGKAVSYEGTGERRVVADSKWEQLGDGGIQTTPSELVRWATQYWTPTIGAESMLSDRLDDAAEIKDPTGEVVGRYGAGIEIIDDPDIGTMLSHSGGWGGFVTAFVLVPEQRVALAATCTSPDTAMALGVDSDEALIEPWLD